MAHGYDRRAVVHAAIYEPAEDALSGSSSSGNVDSSSRRPASHNSPDHGVAIDLHFNRGKDLYRGRGSRPDRSRQHGRSHARRVGSNGKSQAPDDGSGGTVTGWDRNAFEQYWYELRAAAIIDLGLTEEHFWSLTSRELDALFKRKRQAERTLDARFAALLCQNANLNRPKGASPYRIEDFLARDKAPTQEDQRLMLVAMSFGDGKNMAGLPDWAKTSTPDEEWRKRHGR